MDAITPAQASAWASIINAITGELQFAVLIVLLLFSLVITFFIKAAAWVKGLASLVFIVVALAVLAVIAAPSEVTDWDYADVKKSDVAEAAMKYYDKTSPKRCATARPGWEIDLGRLHEVSDSACTFGMTPDQAYVIPDPSNNMTNYCYQVIVRPSNGEETCHMSYYVEYFERRPRYGILQQFKHWLGVGASK
jgi:hypothetical protein